jgi:hypothetical protein
MLDAVTSELPMIESRKKVNDSPRNNDIFKGMEGVINYLISPNDLSPLLE